MTILSLAPSKTNRNATAHRRRLQGTIDVDHGRKRVGARGLREQGSVGKNGQLEELRREGWKSTHGVVAPSTSDRVSVLLVDLPGRLVSFRPECGRVWLTVTLSRPNRCWRLIASITPDTPAPIIATRTCFEFPIVKILRLKAGGSERRLKLNSWAERERAVRLNGVASRCGGRKGTKPVSKCGDPGED